VWVARPWLLPDLRQALGFESEVGGCYGLPRNS
jgi:hypothetical protein